MEDTKGISHTFTMEDMKGLNVSLPRAQFNLRYEWWKNEVKELMGEKNFFSFQLKMFEIEKRRMEETNFLTEMYGDTLRMTLIEWENESIVVGGEMIATQLALRHNQQVKKMSKDPKEHITKNENESYRFNWCCWKQPSF